MTKETHCPDCAHLMIGHYDLPTKLGCAYDKCPCKRSPVLPPAEPWPAPLVGCRLAEDSEIPKTAKSIIKLCEENKWTIVRGSYSIGALPVTTTNWEPGKLAESFVLLAHKGDLKFVAGWIDHSFSFAYVHSKERKEMKKINSIDLRSVLKGELS